MKKVKSRNPECHAKALKREDTKRQKRINAGVRFIQANGAHENVSGFTVYEIAWKYRLLGSLGIHDRRKDFRDIFQELAQAIVDKALEENVIQIVRHGDLLEAILLNPSRDALQVNRTSTERKYRKTLIDMSTPDFVDAICMNSNGLLRDVRGDGVREIAYH